MSTNKFLGLIIMGVLAIGIIWTITHLPSIIAIGLNLAGLAFVLAILALLGFYLYQLLRNK